MIIKSSYEEMSERIKFLYNEVDEEVVLSYNKDLLKKEQDYFHFSEKYLNFLRSILFENFFIPDRKLDFNRYLIEDILMNAYERGNGGNLNLPFWVKISKGEKGNILQVRDSGEGFNLEKKLNQLRNGKKYYSRWGRGLRLFNDSSDPIFYEGKNNIVNYVVFHDLKDVENLIRI